MLYDVKTGQRIAKIGDELDAVLAADVNASHTLVWSGDRLRIRLKRVDILNCDAMLPSIQLFL